METNFIYSKLRNEFGKQCMFVDRGPELIDNYLPDKRRQDRYIRKDPCDRETNLEPTYAIHEANTEVIEYKTSMVSHMEGGWPKDILYNDIEQIERFRRKAMKEDNYIHSVLSLSAPVEKCIMQNNAVNIYQRYYSDVQPSPFIEQNNCKTVNVYKMPGSPRPVTNLSWSPLGNHIVATHCDLTFQAREPTSTNSFVWEVENPNSPDMILTPESSCCAIEYNTKDPNILCCGLMSGQTGFFDLRRGPTPVMVCPIELAHRDPCNQIHWISSKTNTDFFSGSTDGSVKWYEQPRFEENLNLKVTGWDTRNNLKENTDELIMDVLMAKNEEPQVNRALGISSLEFEHTMPTKFMCGTETGKVFVVNRKGKTQQEKLAGMFNAHLGPVHCLERNTAFLKNFLTIGDWTARIWAEDVRESCIVWTAFHKCFLRHACWSTARYSLFFCVRDDGVMDCWDVLQQQNAPIYTMKVSDEPLRKIMCHSEGRQVALGTSKGTIYLIEVSESMVNNTPRDKPFLTAMFDRESKREKILESRARELRLLKSGVKQGGKEDDEGSGNTETAEENEAIAAEQEYFAEVEKALNAAKEELPVDLGTESATPVEKIDEIPEPDELAES